MGFLCAFDSILCIVSYAVLLMVHAFLPVWAIVLTSNSNVETEEAGRSMYREGVGLSLCEFMLVSGLHKRSFKNINGGAENLCF